MLIPFSRLYLSDANVRKTRSEEDDTAHEIIPMPEALRPKRVG